MMIQSVTQSKRKPQTISYTWSSHIKILNLGL